MSSFRHISAVHLIILSSILFTHKFSTAADAIDRSGAITSSRSLVSSGGKFELGFFTPGRSNNWYVGIWFKNIPEKTVVWVASRETPLANQTSGTLKISGDRGILVLQNETGDVIWSTTTRTAAKNPVLQLLESGNLVLREADDDRPENYLWQSFDYPTDTILIGMPFGMNSVLKENYLSSWRSSDDPAPGEYTVHFDPTGYPQVIGKRNEVVMYRLGPWNGKLYSGTPKINVEMPNIFRIYKNKEGVWYYLETPNNSSSLLTRHTVTPAGIAQRSIWSDRSQSWNYLMSNPMDNCDSYKFCGVYGLCTIGNLPVCGCLDRFVPRNPQEWADGDWSNGCIRRTPLSCEKGDGFLRFKDVKLPDARNSWYNESMTLDECRVHCLKNCSCMAYSSLDVNNGESGCLVWFGELVDMRALMTSPGQPLYIRIASSELDGGGRRKLILSLTIVGAFLLVSGLALCIYKRKKNRTKWRKAALVKSNSKSEEMELPLFDLSTISHATNSFALANKLGEGGYGPVYKGTLPDGRDVAVKRLSETSKQGLKEFKNEVICIANLQHRNLVKLLGCCIQDDEKMLIYEYMPNKSLDRILFDETSTSLDWPTRFNIVNGIARGLMYLHHDSRMRVIHRDLKASNILLDREMNAKISDFGIAKPYKGNETGDMTNQVVGTHGYISPEYVISGRFSVKSDVFSFGVLVLEIVSGKRNSSYSYADDHHLNLLTHAWLLHKEGRSIELVDSHLRNSDNIGQVLRLLHVGLLCVQHHPDDRPSMISVVTLLDNDDADLPPANQPCFFTEMYAPGTGSYNLANISNEVSITVVEGR